MNKNRVILFDTVQYLQCPSVVCHENKGGECESDITCGWAHYESSVFKPGAAYEYARSKNLILIRF
jgi:hypothetical protein